MPPDVAQFRRHLQAFDFSRLLVEELGWNFCSERPTSIQAESGGYELRPVAEKAGFVVYVCGPDPEGRVPLYPIRRKIERQAAKTHYEHLIIFVDAAQTRQLWQWVKREGGKPAACREYEFRKGQRGDALIQRLQDLSIGLDEEEGVNISLVTMRVQQALDAERVTRRFYDRFKKELETFRSFIQGITSQGDREWYASLMLNRMMFVYFIQKQGFLDNDHDYLQNRLKRLQQKSGQGQFQQFYRLFLLKLFHEGLGQPEAARAPELAELLGTVPYLNGGLFDVHDLERDNPGLQIPDEAFQKVFDFFDGYRWHLDERPHRAENEINPDVLGYIFEKYINQKQMGAYYTKEDITGYIARNTVIPFLFDTARKECPVAFAPGGGVWRLLKDDPDKYIYPAVGHGVTYNARDTSQQSPPRLEIPCELPQEIAAGIGDVSKREGWNRPAPEEYALPTETWREVVARRQRHQEVRNRLAAGEVHDINDLITLNLDICRFAEDVIVQSEGPELVRAFFHALQRVSVLDPACGSGAFLFAALNILEPLYTACLEGMQGLRDDLESSQRPHHPETMRDFRDILEQVGKHKHPSPRYYILKSIVINNLYGVDIMEEAVEICKLRLFLKLVAQLETYAQIEPLPDIDFNIRPGNTLVGFTSLEAVRQTIDYVGQGGKQGDLLAHKSQEQILTRIEEDAEIADRAFNRFREQQTSLGGEVTAGDKADLRRRLDSLRAELNRYLAAEYGIDLKDAPACEKWRASHQPFHWFVEFYGIMHQGGFDVIIGNPPYVEYSKVKKEYTIQNYETESCGNLYALFVERSIALMRPNGRFGMIVQLPIVCTDRMKPLQKLCIKKGSLTCFANFDDRPARLFDGLEHIRACIFNLQKEGSSSKECTMFTTSYNRWYTENRPTLFSSLSFVDSTRYLMDGAIPKIGDELAKSVRQRLDAFRPLGESLKKWSQCIVYFHNAPQYWIRAMKFIPYFWNERDGEQVSGHIKPLYLLNQADASIVTAVLNSSLFYWWFILLSNCRDLVMREIERFPLGLESMSEPTKQKLAELADELMHDLKAHSQRKEAYYKTTGQVIYDEFYPKHSKPIIDEIDRVLAEHYGFTDEELDFIINYDIKYRMGRGE